jgi:hypothetical protein
VLSQPNAILYFIEGNGVISEGDKKDFDSLYRHAYQQKGIPVYVITTALDNVVKNLSQPEKPGASFFKVDYTAFRTAARTNPCIYLLQQGTVVNKWSGKETGDAIEAIQEINNK